MAIDLPQRAYRAACPGCGAPVEFRSAQSSHAVCRYCQSTVLRQGDRLARLGKMAELFDDHSPLRLLASGKIRGQGFVLVGRLQYRSSQGVWAEWLALQDDGVEAILGEDNGAYVYLLPYALNRPLPQASDFRVGSTTGIEGKPFSVSASSQVALVSAQGELPWLPTLGVSFGAVELRSSDGEIIAIDYGAEPPALFRGRSVSLEELALTGIASESAREETGRHFSCPQCGAPVAVKLSNSKSITCASCKSLIDLSAGTGAELKSATQAEPVEPLIALGSIGRLQGQLWQVVGFQHRMGHEPGDIDEQFGWSEYLLYNLKRGFIFVVDADDGWSVVKPTTGAPTLSDGGESAHYLGTRYQLKVAYHAQTSYVSGEFYWQVERGQKSFNRDFTRDNSLLSMEETPKEITWSSGGKVSSDTIAKAFNMEQRMAMLERSDVLPAGGSTGLGKLVQGVFIVAFLVLLAALEQCSDCDPSRENCFIGGGARNVGGSYGGGSSGGGHK